MRKRPTFTRTSITLKQARIVALSASLQTKHLDKELERKRLAAVKFTEEHERERGVKNGRAYRNQSADWQSDAGARFGAIYARGCYQRRRGR